MGRPYGYVPYGTPAAQGSGIHYPTAAPPNYPIPGAAFAPNGIYGAPARPEAMQPTVPGPPLQPKPPDNMSSLTRYTLKVKEEFQLDPPVPAVALEEVQVAPLEFSSTLEDEIIAAAPEPLLEDSLIGNLAAASLSPKAPDTPAASPDEEPLQGGVVQFQDVEEKRVLPFLTVEAGSPSAVRLALALFGSDSDAVDEEKVLKFCAAFDKCRSVLPDASDADIAAAVLVDGGEEEAMNSLLSASQP